MNILIIEDEDIKFSNIKRVIDGLNIAVNLHREKSVRGGSTAVRTKQYDLIISDMGLPVWDVVDGNVTNEHYDPKGGMTIGKLIRFTGNRVLFNSVCNGGVCKTLIYISQSKELDEMPLRDAVLSLNEGGVLNVIDGIYYDPTNNEWERVLENHIMDIFSKQQNYFHTIKLSSIDPCCNINTTIALGCINTDTTGPSKIDLIFDVSIYGIAKRCLIKETVPFCRNDALCAALSYLLNYNNYNSVTNYQINLDDMTLSIDNAISPEYNLDVIINNTKYTVPMEGKLAFLHHLFSVITRANMVR